MSYAVKLVKNAVRVMKPDMTKYPSIDKMTNFAAQIEDIPPVITKMLRPMLKTDIKVACLGQQIIKSFI